jgi:hypothetical protein
MSKFDAEVELRERLHTARERGDGSVIFVVGAGVARGASGDAPASDWKGLLRLGLAECNGLAKKGRLPDSVGWKPADVQRAIKSDQGSSLVQAASQIEAALIAAGVYADWLKKTVGALEPKNREVLDAIRALQVPIATCNYDGLIEAALEIPGITWRDHGMVTKFLRGNLDAVLHLHGHFREPQSVVLGIDSYDRIVGNQHAQAVQRALFLERTLVFVGFGAGLDDPNFGALLDWAAEVVPGSDCFHVRLAVDDQVGVLMAERPLTQRVHVVGYGKKHTDLAPFLRALRPAIIGSSSEDKSSGSGGSGSAVIVNAVLGSVKIAGSTRWIRIVLDFTLPVSSDFDAFCMDYFPSVYRRFGGGMERVEKTNLLLSVASTDEVLDALKQSHPSELQHAMLKASQATGDTLPPPVATPPPRARPAVSALYFLDRTAQYGGILVGAPAQRSVNRLLLLHGGPEQNLEWFVMRLEAFLYEDAGMKVLNVPMCQDDTWAGSAEDWGLRLKHALEAHTNEAHRPLKELLTLATQESPLLLTIVAKDNPLEILGDLSTGHLAGLQAFLTEYLPKLLSGVRRVSVLLPLEIRVSVDSDPLLKEAQTWAERFWHTAERAHKFLPEVHFPTREDVHNYLRSHRPPLRELPAVLREADKLYDRLGKQSTFEQLAKELNNIVRRYS